VPVHPVERKLAAIFAADIRPLRIGLHTGDAGEEIGSFAKPHPDSGEAGSAEAGAAIVPPRPESPSGQGGRGAITTSTHSVFPDSTSPLKLNPVEPPWYGPVCPVVGEGWHREVSPYPNLGSRTTLRPWLAG
jgi:hypothetical protein